MRCLPTQRMGCTSPQTLSGIAQNTRRRYPERRQLVVVAGRRAAKNAARKGKSNALKSKVFGKYGKLVFMAVRQGGPDPVTNRALADIMRDAQAAKIPKDIIERARKRATDTKSADMEPTTYEVYGPGGTGWIIECLTDNTNRSKDEVWHVVRKAKAKWATPGSVLFNFTHQAEFVLAPGMTEDEAMDVALAAEADDMLPVPEEEERAATFKLVAQADRFSNLRDYLREAGVEYLEEMSGLKYAPLSEVEVENEADHDENESMYYHFLEMEDVDAVYTNCSDVGV